MAQKHPKILEMWKPENMVENSLLLDRLDQFYKNIDDSYIDFIIPYDVMKKKRLLRGRKGEYSNPEALFPPSVELAKKIL